MYLRYVLRAFKVSTLSLVDLKRLHRYFGLFRLLRNERVNIQTSFSLISIIVSVAVNQGAQGKEE